MKKKPEPESSTTDSRAPPEAADGTSEKLENWADKADSAAYKEAAKLYTFVQSAYDNQADAAREIEEFWRIYAGLPDENLMYAGNSQGYVPVCRDAINARAKRALKQLFPLKHKHIEAVGSGDDTPYPQLALLEHYIRKLKLKDVVRSDLVAGDVTGQWNLYIDWSKSYRRVTELVKRNPVMQMDGEDTELTDATTEADEKEEVEVIEEGPEVVDFATEDLAVVPPTCNDLEKATATSLILRMSKAKVRQMVDEGVFVLPDKTDISTWMVETGKWAGSQAKPADEQRCENAGIRVEGTDEHAAIYEVAAMLDFEDSPKGEKKSKSLGLIYFAGESDIVGIIKAPWWGGKRPILSAPIERIKGSFRGVSKIEPVKFMQWQLVDFWNMGQDSGMYSMLPIVMTDPLSNPNYATMVYGLAAVWAADPNKTKFANFPMLWKDAANVVDNMKRQIWESMDVNEMMMGRMPAGRKNNGMVGAVQQEQMTNIMDHAERYESEMLDPLVERLFEYDRQFRTKPLTVLTMGEVGVKASMQEVEPQQFGERYFFQWAGTSEVMGMQRMQQQIATLNVLRGIPPQALNGITLNISPIIELITDNVFGPELTPRILVDNRNKFTIPAEVENEIMHNGIPVEVHEADDDIAHIQSHQSVAKITGDPGGRLRAHLAKHVMALRVKQEMAMGQQQAQGGGVPGAPGPSVGGQAAPGMAGTPKAGAMPADGRPAQQPPGAIHADQMVSPGIQGRG